MPENHSRAERAHPSLEPLVQAGVSAAGAAAAAAFAAWAVGASPTAKIVLAFLVCVSVFGTLLILRARGNRAAIAFGITSTTLTAVVAVALSGAAQRDPRAAPNDAIQARLILHSGDASIVAIRRVDPPEIGRQLDGDAFELKAQRLEAAGAVSHLGFEVDVVSERYARLWLQRVRVERCRQRDGTIECLLPDGLSWRASDFVSVSTTDANGSVVDRSVAAVGPGDDCNTMAGKSLRAGAALFKSSHHPITVESMDDARWAGLAPDGTRFVAVAGSYNSSASKRLLDRCGDDCGPILTFSSAQSLRTEGSDGAWLFRMTSSNRRRALDLVSLLESEFAELQDERVTLEARCATAPDAHACAELDDGRPFAELQIVYNDDRPKSSAVSYAYDQALELQRALSDPSALPSLYWVRFGDDWVASDAAPSASDPSRVSRSGFSELVRALRKRTQHPIVVFVDLDPGILSFGSAIRDTDDGDENKLRWYVPGPRELFEGTWTECLTDAPSQLAALRGVRVLSPDDNNTSIKASQFAALWAASEYRRSPIPFRAARMYDALEAIEKAVRRLDANLQRPTDWVTDARGRGRKLAFVHIGAYRHLLRDELRRTAFYGASGTIAFDDRGDLLNGSFVAELGSHGLQPIIVRPDRNETTNPPDEL